jgi:hypothetical protein
MHMIVPFYLKTADFDEPTDSMYYLAAANGTFLVKKTGLFAAVTATTTMAGLDQATPALELHFPRIPSNILEQTYGFFRDIYRRFDGEAIVFIYYSPERNEFKVEPPPQRLTRRRTRSGWSTAARVEYQTIARPSGYFKLGDVHSHADSKAFFSSTDDEDDEEDGLRVVMGRFDRARPDVCVSFVANGTRFGLQVGDVLEEFVDPLPPPSAWTHRVICVDEDLRERGHRDECERC